MFTTFLLATHVLSTQEDHLIISTWFFSSGPKTLLAGIFILQDASHASSGSSSPHQHDGHDTKAPRMGSCTSGKQPAEHKLVCGCQQADHEIFPLESAHVSQEMVAAA